MLGSQVNAETQVGKSSDANWCSELKHSAVVTEATRGSRYCFPSLGAMVDEVRGSLGSHQRLGDGTAAQTGEFRVDVSEQCLAL